MTALILNAIPGEVWAALGAIVAAVVAWLVGRRGGVRAARVGAKNQAAQDYRETTERMRDAGEDYLADDAVLERLRERAGKR